MTFIGYGGFSPEQQFEALDKLTKKINLAPENPDEIAKAWQLLNKAFGDKSV